MWSVLNLTMLGPNYVENTLLAWSEKSKTIYVGMPSINSISRNWCVLPYWCQHTNTNQYLIWLNLLEVNPPQTHMQHILVFGWIWSILTDLGMLTGISKQVVRCVSLSVSVHQHQLAPNMTIAGRTNTYHLGYKGESYHSRFRHIKHCIQHNDICKIAAVFCVYW